MTTRPTGPLPAKSPLTDALSAGLARGFSLQHCPACDRFIYYPRVVCPVCLSPDLEWRPVEGRGEISSFGIVWRPLHAAFVGQVPLCLCSVRLLEGPTVLGLLEGCPPADARIGMAVRVVGREQAPGVFLMRFETDPSGSP